MKSLLLSTRTPALAAAVNKTRLFKKIKRKSFKGTGKNISHYSAVRFGRSAFHMDDSA